jgi:hypothetical protein
MGSLRIVSRQDIGGFGPKQGEPSTVQIPLSDAGRSSFLWLILVGLLILCPANRTRYAWSLFFMTIGICVFIQAIEYGLSRFFLFHWHINFCLVMSEALQFFAVSWAILLCVSHRFRTRIAFIRFVLLLVTMVVLGSIAAWLCPWTFLPGAVYPLLYCVCVCIFWTGHAVVRYVINKLISPSRYMLWYSVWCLFIGWVPILVLSTTQYVLSRSVQLQSTMELFRMSIFFCSLLCLPYAIYACFLLLAGNSTFWRERLGHCFGLPCSQVS